MSNHLEQYAAALPGLLADEIKATAFELQARAQQLVPVRTGLLRRSIHTLFSNGGLTATIGPSAAYGKFVEFGTRYMAGRAYMRPAAEWAIPRLVPRIQARLRAA